MFNFILCYIYIYIYSYVVYNMYCIYITYGMNLWMLKLSCYTDYALCLVSPAPPATTSFWSLENNISSFSLQADTRSQPPAYTSLAAEPANQPRPRSAMPQGSRPRSAMPPQGSRPASHQPPRGQQRPSQSREARQQQYELQQQQLSRQQRRH